MDNVEKLIQNGMKQKKNVNIKIMKNVISINPIFKSIKFI